MRSDLSKTEGEWRVEPGFVSHLLDSKHCGTWPLASQMLSSGTAPAVGGHPGWIQE